MRAHDRIAHAVAHDGIEHAVAHDDIEHAVAHDDIAHAVAHDDIAHAVAHDGKGQGTCSSSYVQYRIIDITPIKENRNTLIHLHLNAFLI